MWAVTIAVCMQNTHSMCFTILFLVEKNWCSKQNRTDIDQCVPNVLLWPGGPALWCYDGNIMISYIANLREIASILLLFFYGLQIIELLVAVVTQIALTILRFIVAKLLVVLRGNAPKNIWLFVFSESYTNMLYRSCICSARRCTV